MTTPELKVSVLDDHLLMRSGLCQALERAGIRVVGAHGDAASFLQGLDAELPSSAIVDLILREGDGLNVLQTAHERHPQLPIIVLSGSTEQGIVERCFELGASAYLDKGSADLNAVLDAITGVVNGQRVYPAQAMHNLSVKPGAADPRWEILERISTREREVLSFVADGADNLKIAAHLNISERTVRAHVSSLYRKLGVENRTQMALLAQRLRVTGPRA
jgi:DNA-binding NarL/FixJ family response regulator